MKYTYLILLVINIISMLIIDKKYSLAFFYDAKRTITTLAVGLVIFVIWDIGGIILNIFYSPGSPYVTGWYLGKDFPIEEIFFLFFLCYFTLVMYLLGVKKWRRI